MPDGILGAFGLKTRANEHELVIGNFTTHRAIVKGPRFFLPDHKTDTFDCQFSHSLTLSCITFEASEIVNLDRANLTALPQN